MEDRFHAGSQMPGYHRLRDSVGDGGNTEDSRAAAVLLGVARIAGETAPLLFTSFNNRYWSNSWDQPVASLPVMIFTYAIAPYEDWHAKAWGTALVLISLVLLLNVLARLVAWWRVRRLGSVVR